MWPKHWSEPFKYLWFRAAGIGLIFLDMAVLEHPQKTFFFFIFLKSSMLTEHWLNFSKALLDPVRFFYRKSARGRSKCVLHKEFFVFGEELFVRQHHNFSRLFIRQFTCNFSILGYMYQLYCSTILSLEYSRNLCLSLSHTYTYGLYCEILRILGDIWYSS